MDAVDILQFAVDAARMIRNAPDPQGLFGEAWPRFAGAVQQPAENLPWSVRIAQLVEAAEERRSELYRFLKAFRGQFYLNRNVDLDKNTPVSESVTDPRATALLQYLGSPAARAEKINLFLGNCAGPYEVGRRRIIHMLPDYVADKGVQFPKAAFGLIDDPLERPVLFDIHFEEEGYWNLFEVLEAFADQYHMIYENPRHFGVRGHDLSNLWIEQLQYYPSKKLIHPYIGT